MEKFLDLPTHDYANIVVSVCNVFRQLQHVVVGVECWLHFELEACGYSVQTIHWHVEKLLAGDWILIAEFSAWPAFVSEVPDLLSSVVLFVESFLRDPLFFPKLPFCFQALFSLWSLFVGTWLSSFLYTYLALFDRFTISPCPCLFPSLLKTSFARPFCFKFSSFQIIHFRERSYVQYCCFVQIFLWR